MPFSTAPLLLAVLTLAATVSAPAGAPATDQPEVRPEVRPAIRTEVRTAAAAPPGAAGTSVRGGWRWPLSPTPAVVRPFVPPPSPYAAGHRGADLAAADGTTVYAVAAGRVTHVGSVAGRGTVTVLHPGGVSSTYEPVLGTVSVGAEVGAGSVLGTVSGASHCPASCLHLGARRDGPTPTYLDPLRLIRGGPVILLPLRSW